jgi:SanA protein
MVARRNLYVENAIVISQGFHLPRAVFIANSVGLNAQGAVASDSPHLSSKYMKNREVLARVKACLEVVFNVSPRYLGEAIPITGNSSASFD